MGRRSRSRRGHSNRARRHHTRSPSRSARRGGHAPSESSSSDEGWSQSVPHTKKKHRTSSRPRKSEHSVARKKRDKKKRKNSTSRDSKRSKHTADYIYHHKDQSSESLLDELARMIQPDEAPQYGKSTSSHSLYGSLVSTAVSGDVQVVPSPLVPSLHMTGTVTPSQMVPNSASLAPGASNTSASTSAGNGTSVLSATTSTGGGEVVVTRHNFLPQALAERHFPRLNPAVIREARRIYVGNLPQGSTDADVKDFFERHLRLLTDPVPTLQSGDPLPPTNVSLVSEVVMRLKDNERPYAFMEFIDDNLATIALQRLQDIAITAHGSGKSSELRLGRPKEYREHLLLDIPSMVFVSGLPLAATQDEIREMFAVFGAIRNAWVMTDATTRVSKGRALILFEDESVVPSVCQTLHDQAIEEGGAGLRLVVRIANDKDRMDVIRNREISLEEGFMEILSAAPTACTVPGASSYAGNSGSSCAMVVSDSMTSNGFMTALYPTNEIGKLDPTSLTPKDLLRFILASTDRLEDIINAYFRGQTAQGKILLGPTRVVVLLNLVNVDELDDDEDYQNLIMDVELEMERHGCVEEILIPRYPPEPPDRALIAECVRKNQKLAKPADHSHRSLALMDRASEGGYHSHSFDDSYQYMPGANSHDIAVLQQQAHQQQQEGYMNLVHRSDFEESIPPDFELLLAEAFDRARNQWEADCMHPVKNGIGHVFVKYHTVEEALRAQQRVAGRRFNGRTVITTYIAEEYLIHGNHTTQPTQHGYYTAAICEGPAQAQIAALMNSSY